MAEFIDRGFDRGVYRFCVVVGVGQTQAGAWLDTARGRFRVLVVGREYTRHNEPVQNAYLEVDPVLVNAPVDSLTAEQIAYRATANRNRMVGGAAWRALLKKPEAERTPDEQAKVARACKRMSSAARARNRKAKKRTPKKRVPKTRRKRIGE